MSLFATLSQAVPAHQVSGRFCVEVVGLCYPRRADGEGGCNRLVPRAAFRPALDLPALFAEGTRSPFARTALRDHVLVCRPEGEFFSTDELAVARVENEQGRCLIEVMVTRREDQDGEAAPRDLYLLVCVETGKPLLRRLELHFSGRRRDFNGHETALNEPAAVTQHIEVTN